MRKIRWYIGLFLLAAFCCLGRGEYSKAQERPIYLNNGQMAEDSDENISEADLYQVGDTGEIHIGNMEELPDGQISKKEYLSSDTAVLQVDQTGRYQIVGGGKAIITVKGYNSEGVLIFSASHCFRCCADVSGAALKSTEFHTYIINGQAEDIVVPFTNMPNLVYYTFGYTSSNTGMEISCTLDPQAKALKIFSVNKGTTTLTITINNMTFTLTVIASEVSINKTSALLTAKGTVTLKVKGYPGKVTWKTMKNKVASVSAKGVVKAKKTGNVVVYAEMGGRKIGCAISVVTPKLKKVVNAAKKIGKGKYSQPRRMRKGYYDCSSLVWRAYKKIGKTFGDRGYAPVAANIAKYLFGKKKRIQGGLNNKNIQGMKLRPGDLMFLTGAKNGRYKGIYHVEMFVGYQCEGFDSKGKPILGTLWAVRPPNYYYGNPMGRP